VNLHHRSYIRLLLVLCMVLLLSGCGSGYERIHPTRNPEEIGEYYDAVSIEQMTFDDFCMTVFRDELTESDTLDLHYTLAYPESYGIVHEDTSLGTCRLEDMIQNIHETKTLRKKIAEFDYSKLRTDQKVIFDTLLDTLDTALMAEGLELYDQPLAPTIGVQAQLPILLAEYAFYSEQDIEDYLSLLTQIDQYYAEILEFEQQKAAAGLGPSDETLAAIIQSCENYLITPDNNFLTETFTSRINKMETSVNSPSLTKEQKLIYSTRHINAIKDHFIPAYQLLMEGLSELKGRGLNDGGLCGFKNGKSYYEYLLKSGPGLSYSVEELKTAINSRMQKDLDAVNELYRKYPDLNNRILSAKFTLTDPSQILEDLKQQMARDFPALKDCSYEINNVPSQLENALSPAFYLTAPLDNTDHNIIYINNRYEDASTGLYTTLAHEGFPGHLYQTVYSRTNTTTPLLPLLSCSGANEGWATYVENYACTLDNGLPDGVGEYQALTRSFSLCVHGMLDIGINYDGWTKNQAADYVKSCFAVDDETVNRLWQTMIDSPTNYLEYCGGYLEIMEMREFAELTLEEDFSLLEFHRFLLDIGPLPFSIIRKYFDSWLESQTSIIKS